MSTLNELLARAQEVRDEQEVGANTALRVGQLLADIIQWCADTDADLVTSIEHYVAQLNEMDGIINWWQSRVVLLKTMGSDFDDVDVSTLSDGELYYDKLGKWLFERENGGSVNGHHPSEGVLYVNLANGQSYQWDGTTMVKFTDEACGTLDFGFVGTVDDIPVTVIDDYVLSWDVVGDSYSFPSAGGSLTIHVTSTKNGNFQSANISAPEGVTLNTTQTATGYTIEATVASNSGVSGSLTVTQVGSSDTLSLALSQAGVPSLSVPATLDVGTNHGDGVSNTFQLTAANLTAGLTLAASGTGFSVSPQSLTAEQANAGATITVTYNGTTENATGTLTITSANSEVEAAEVELSADYSEPIYGWVEQPLTLYEENKYMGKVTAGNAITGSLGTSPNYNLYSAAVTAGEQVKIVASSQYGGMCLFTFADASGKATETSTMVGSGGEGTSIITKEKTVPADTVIVYISENKNANGVGSSKLYKWQLIS